MAEDRAKWDEAYERWRALDPATKDKSGSLFSERHKSGQGLDWDAALLHAAIEEATTEVSALYAKQHFDDVVQDYEDALAGADIIRNIKGE